ncbi:MAG: hypothetical protein K0S23_3153 [Fluviicola sp.]|nr:hypothetical protein [Fluviicola sp.]
MKYTYSLNRSELFWVYMRYHFMTNKNAYLFFILMDALILLNIREFTLSVLIILSFPLLHLLSSILDTYSFVKNKIVPAIGGSYIMEIKNNTIEFTDEDGNFSSYKLDFIISIQKKKKAYFIIFKNLNQLFLPLGIFETPEEEMAFFELIEKNKGVPRQIARPDVLDS